MHYSLSHFFPMNFTNYLTDTQIDLILDDLGWELEEICPYSAADKQYRDQIWDCIEALRIEEESRLLV